MKDNDFVLKTDDLRVDALAEEFVSLRAIWGSEGNVDYLRSLAILKELDSMKLSPYQNSQVSHFIRLSWITATGRSRELDIIPNSPTGDRVSLQIAGLCLVQSRMNADALNLG